MSYNSNQFRRGLPRRLSAMILAVCMVFTMSPPVTAAGVTDSGKILLSGFAELPENIREQSVPLGVSLGELTLPDTMTATVGAASVDAKLTPDTEPEEPKDSGAATMPTEEQPTLGTSDEPASKAEIIEENDVPLAASPSDAENNKPEPTPPSNDITTSAAITVSGITWESDPLYDNETEGTYLFTAVLPSGYTVEDGVAMPVITVVVGQAEQSAVDKVIAMIDALPTMDEWTAMDETAARTVMNEILAAKKAYDALTAEEKAQIEVTSTAKLTELAEMAQQLANTMPMADDVRLEFKSDSPSVSGTGYEWVLDTKTLTLNGLTATSVGAVGIRVPDGATLVVNGTNSLTVTGAADDSNTRPRDYQNYGILCGLFESGKETTLGALTIEGSGTLAVTCAYTGAESLSYSWGMKAKSITMNGGTVTCTGDKAGESYGVLAEDAITINGGSLSGISGENTEFGSVSYGVCTETGNITVNSGGTLKGTGSTGMMMNNLTVDGGSVIGVGKGDDSQNMGVVANNDLTINSGTLTGTAEDCTDMSVGVGAQGTIAVNGGTVTATSGTSAMSIAVMAAAALTTGDGVIIKCNSAGNTGYADEANFALVGGGAPGMVYEGADQTTVATDVKIYKSAPASPALIFKTDTADVSGTGYAWVKDTKTLTLTDFDHTTNANVGIQLPDGATLVLNGANSLTVTGVTPIAQSMSVKGNYGIFCGDEPRDMDSQTLYALTIEGSGTLSVTCAYTGAESLSYSWGMKAKSITMNGGTVTCTGDKANSSYGVLVEDAITINGGSLSGIGRERTEFGNGSYGVSTKINPSDGSVTGSITVNGGTLKGTGKTGVTAFDLTVDGGSVIGVGVDSSYLSSGVAVANDLTVNSGSLTATGGTVEDPDGMSSAVRSVNTPTTGEGVVIKCNSAGNTGYTGETNVAYNIDWSEYMVYEGADQTTVATDVKIYKSAPASPALDFATEGSTTPHTGTGYEWVLDTKTLTLTDFNYTATDPVGIILPDGAALVLNGASSVTAGDGTLLNSSSAISCLGTLTVSGTGSLVATAGTGAISTGVVVETNLILNSGSLTGIGGFGELSIGVLASSGDITVNGGSLVGSAGTGIGVGVYAQAGAITVNSGSLIGKAATENKYFAVMAETITPATDVVVKCNIGSSTGYTGDTNIAVHSNDIPLNTVYEGADQTDIAKDVKIYKLPSYAVTINVNKDNSAWSGHGKTFKLSKDDGNTFVTDLTKVADGTYTVYDGNTSTGVTVAVSGAAALATVEYYTVTFYDGGTAYSIPAPQVVLKTNGRVTKPADPSKTGYTFAGWKTADGGATAFDFTNTAITAATGVYASWKANTYTVTLSGNGGTGTPLTTYTYGVGATLPTGWTKTGYTFEGWYDNAGLTGSAVTTISATDTGNKEYWANWEVISVSGVSLDKTSATLVTGETEALTATVLPADAANKSVTWQSSNTSVATVANGTVTAVDAGTAVITVSTVDGSKTATCTVTVNKNDAQLVAAAKTKIVDGTVNVAFGATQADKTAAVQTYVDALLTGDAAGVTATVTHTSGGSYSVTISKGSVTDSKSITMTVNVAPDPDIATVAAAKTAAENATYTATTQSATGTEFAAQTYVQNIAKTAVNNSGVTVTVNKVSYTAPIAGTSADSHGTNGSYVFTVTVSKGTQSQTTVQKTLTITATAFTGVTDAEAVAAAKDAVVDGTVTVAFGATQADKTAAVQTYVNSKLTGDAAGVTATVTYNSGTGKYDVALSKGSVTDSKSITMTVNVAPDPDIATVTAAKTAAENATYTATTQAATGTESAAQTYVQNIAKTAVNNNGVTVTVNKVSYTAPVAGTSSDKDGINGSYVFTVTVSKGTQSQTTTQKTLTITATPYTGVTDAEAVAAAKDAVVDGTVTVPTGATQADKTAAVQSYVNDRLAAVPSAAGVTATVTYNSGTGKYDVTLSKGTVSDNKTITMTVTESADPDLATVTAAKTAAENATYTATTQGTTGTESAAQTYVKNIATTAVNNSGVTVTVNKVSYTAPVAGTPSDKDGTNGSYAFTITVSKGSQSETTVQKTLTITATPYTGVTDAEAVAAAKDAVVDGTVTVPTGATQADKTAAVQSYVNDRLAAVPSAAGVTATVTYNSGTGKYDVTLSKGTVSDNKTITMTVTESADPDLATVTAAKTAAENATYTATTQGTTGTESATQTYVKNIATTAVNNSGVTVTVNKVSYTAPVAGTSSDRDGTNGSYIFTITVSKGSQRQTTTQITVVITATAYSGSTGGDGGGGGGGGGSTGGGTTTPPTSKPTEPVTGNTENKATVDDKGNANVSISDKNITDAIANAKAEADKKGVNAGEITAVINVTTGGKDATTVSVNLPKVVQEQVIGNKIAKVELVIDRPDLTIGMNLSAVTEINKQANADVQISASKTNAATLSADAKAAIGNRPAYDLKATYQSGGKSVTNFGAGTVSIEIPYKLQSGENAGNIYAVYVDGNGKVTYLTSSSYDAKRETLVFTTNHFSVYGVGFKATSSKFTDTADHWAKDSIDFVVSRGLMNGTSATTFSPNDAMTRGMFVTTLGRLSGVDVSGYKASSFSDVKADAYYMGYIEWANKNNIVVGIGGGKFAPDALVTREQMAVIMDRYATAIGFKLPEVHVANTFADNTKIGGWSAESVKRIQMAGIITGKTGNVFDPQGAATRAEVSAVVKRFVELAAFSNTAQGWTMNDSGKWMYYEKGKPVTGTKNIDDTTYTFNSYGEIAYTPKKLTYGAYTVKKGDSWWKIASEQKCNIYELARVNGKTIFSFMYAGEVLKIPQQ